jgi:hypothetical protein
LWAQQKYLLSSGHPDCCVCRPCSFSVHSRHSLKVCWYNIDLNTSKKCARDGWGPTSKYFKISPAHALQSTPDPSEMFLEWTCCLSFTLMLLPSLFPSLHCLCLTIVL